MYTALATLPFRSGGARSRAAAATDGVDVTPSARPAALASRARVLALIDPKELANSAYKPKPKDILLGTYRVQRQIGRGSFGTVVRARHLVTNTVVAVKVLHKLDILHFSLHHERCVYEALQRGCTPFISLFAKVLGSGIDGGFSCTVFELCDITLHDIIKGCRSLTPLPSTHICEIANQIIRGVAYLHSLGIIHTDIKPDNIALRRADTTTVHQLDGAGIFHPRRILMSTAICIIDLGGAMLFKQASRMKGLVCSRMYRPPEIILGLPWSYGVDTYAVGCVIAELCLLENLFHRELASDREHLALIERVLDRFTPEFAAAVEHRSPGTFHISHGVSIIFPPANAAINGPSLAAAMQRVLDAEHITARIHDVPLVDLLLSLLVTDPAMRIPLYAVLKHTYFDGLRSDSM